MIARGLRRATLFVLLGGLLFTAGFVAGNLSDPVIAPAWQHSTVAPPEERPPERSATPAETVRQLEQAERKLRDAHGRARQELATAERTAYLMEQHGASAAARRDKAGEIERCRAECRDLETRLEDVARLRQRYQELVEQGRSETDNDLQDLDRLRIRARLWLETRE
jgi:hypothetical protein